MTSCGLLISQSRTFSYFCWKKWTYPWSRASISVLPWPGINSSSLYTRVLACNLYLDTFGWHQEICARCCFFSGILLCFIQDSLTELSVSCSGIFIWTFNFYLYLKIYKKCVLDSILSLILNYCFVHQRNFKLVSLWKWTNTCVLSLWIFSTS